MEIILGILGLLTVSFAVAYKMTIFKMKKMSDSFAEVLMSRVELEKAYENYESLRNSTTNQDIHTQNFIKFLSDSRDWAFEYIESVQNGIKKFMNEVEPQIKNYNKFREKAPTLNEFTIKKISKEIEELKKFLPEETLDRR
jgi:uncharacterized coiled-coil DUF342 family protein